jgi:cell division protein FtsL
VSAVAAPARRAAARRDTRRLRPTAAALVVVCAVLLIGIVTLQIAVLRANRSRGDLENQRLQLLQQNSEYLSQLESLRSAVKVDQRAGELGLVLPTSDLVRELAGGSTR